MAHMWCYHFIHSIHIILAIVMKWVCNVSHSNFSFCNREHFSMFWIWQKNWQYKKKKPIIFNFPKSTSTNSISFYLQLYQVKVERWWDFVIMKYAKAIAICKNWVSLMYNIYPLEYKWLSMLVVSAAMAATYFSFMERYAWNDKKVR